MCVSGISLCQPVDPEVRGTNSAACVYAPFAQPPQLVTQVPRAARRRRPEGDSELKSTEPTSRPVPPALASAAVLLLVHACGLWKGAQTPTDTAANHARGVWGVIFLFLGTARPGTPCESLSGALPTAPPNCCAGAGYSIMQGPSCCMIRPHPAVWRLVHGVALVYLCFLVFLLFQAPMDARLFMRARPAAIALATAACPN